MRYRIAVDMDEVLADTVTKELSVYNREFGAALTKDHIAGKNLYGAVPCEHRDRVREYPRTESFFRDIPVMPGSAEVLPLLFEQHEIFIVTAAMEYPNSFRAKFDWVREHFPFVPDSRVVFCGDKSIVHADFLIDDNSRHFARFFGHGLLFSAPHNLNESHYERLNDWADVRRRFLL
jgi:5'-nucleotidase